MFAPSLLESELQAELRPDQVEALMAAARKGPLFLGISSAVFCGLCIALVVGLLMRLQGAFYASFVMAVLSFGVFFYLAVTIEIAGRCCYLSIAPIVLLGLTFLARDDFAEEEVAVEEERVEYLPGSPLDHYNRGAAYARQKKLDLAIQEWERAVELAPDNIRFRNALALAYAGQGQKEKAIVLLEETLALAPDDAETKSNLQAVQGG
jgi:tetratricopeptide (TPR) repeat protein